MKKHLLKTLLVGVMALAATSAWAADKTVVKYSFDDAMSPSLTAGSRVSFDYDKTSVITSTKFLNAYNNTNGDPGSSTVSLGSTDLSAETWTLSFEWAACGGCNSKADHTTLKAGDTNLFDLTGNSNWNTTVTITYSGSDGTKTLPVPGCDKSKRFTAATGDQLNTTAYWHHIVVTGSSDGVKMTITNSSSGTAVVEDVVLSETNVNPTSLIIEPCCGGAIGIDELSLTYYVEGEVVQTPVANYSAVDGISRTITATCDTEGATLYYSTDGESWTEGAEVTVSETGNVYFKAVKGTSESDVLTFAAVAGEAITLVAPVINRTSNTSVTISADETGILLSPVATIYYTYGDESGSFQSSESKELTVEADATITAYAEADGYTTSETSERAVALFPTSVNQIENAAARTSGWTANAFSEETITASERTYAALMLDGVQWGQNVYLQTSGAWGLRASGNWYINSNTEESWLLMQNMKQGDIIVVNVTYPASSMVNATYSKYSFGTMQAYEVTEDGDVELAFMKINASTMDYLYGVYAYREIATKTIGLVPGPWDVADVTERYAAYVWAGEGEEKVEQWIDFAEVSGAYATVIPETFTGLILVRMNGETTENNWENKWNQTDDIDFTAIADQTVFTITGWGEGEGANSTYTTGTVPTDLSELKAALEEAITEANGLNAYANDETLASAISAAQAALASEETTAEQFVAAATALKIAATNAAKTVLQKVVTLAKQFGMDTTDAEALIANEETTVEQLADALQTLVAQAKEGAAAGIAKAEQFFATFDGEAAAALSEDFSALNTALEGTSIDDIMTATQALITKALPYAKTAMDKVSGYLELLNNETLSGDIAAIKAAIEANNIVEMVAAANKAQTDFLAAIPGYVDGIEFAVAGYKDAGKTAGADQVEAAIAAVREALGTEGASIVTVGAAVRNLILALAQFNEANTTYTIAGTTDLTGTEEAWQIAEANNMTLADGLYTWTAENITVSAEAQPEFKVVITDIDNKQTWIPASEEGDDHNWVITPEYLGGEGEYNITITFNPATQEIGVTGENTKPAQIIPNGTYYVLNAAYDEPQLLMAAGHNWGTKGIVNEKGLDFTFTYNESNNTYDIDSRVSNGGNNHFLSSGLWMDGPSYGWTIEGEFVYTISGTFDGVKKYIAVDANQELILTEDGTADNAQWAFLMKDYWENDVVKAEGLEAMKAATETAPVDATFLIKSPDFNRNDLRNAEVWTMEASNKNLAGGGEGGNGCAESYHSTFTLSQKLADAPAGVYSLTAQGFYRQDGSDNDNLPYFYANDEKQTFPLRTGTENGMDTAGDSFKQGNYTIEPIYVEVDEAGQLTVGAKLETNTSLWCIWDNFQLKYYGPDANIDNLKNAALFAQVDELKEQLKQIVESGEIEVEAATTNLTNLLNNVDDLNPTSSAELAETAIVILKGGIEIAEGYIKAKNVLPQMKALTESTNFYTEEALENYYGQWYQKYEAGELTADEAKALEDPFVVTGWRANNNVDDLLMSTWDVEPMNWEQYYINTWSVEGASDGTQFEVPFFEYWTGDANSLGEKTLTGTIEGLEAGTYGVSAWVRVRGKNDFTRPAYGITMQVNEGTAIDAASTTEVSGTNFYVGQLNAIGEVGEDGKLVLKFNVAADNNISWLSFKNVKFNKMQTFTAKFENPEDTWEKVYAYTWTGGEYDKVEQLGAWPGTEITATVDENGIYTATIAAQEAPANIIFSNGLEGDALVQTEDLTFEDGKTYKYLIPATDIEISPAEGDIYAALEAEKATVKKVGNITIKLTKDATYTVSATLTAPKSIFFYGNDATVTVAEEMTGDFITLDGTEAFAMKSETEASDHKLIASVEVRGVTIKGLQGALITDAQKTLVENLVIDWANIQMPANSKNVLNFNGKGYAGKVTVTNSTIWAADKNTGFFAQYGSRPKNINGDWIQEFDFENNTIVNIANGKNFNNLKQNGTAQNVYTVKNNIFVNCGKQNQVVVGFNNGQTSSTPAWDVTGNYFAWGDACVNAAEAEKAGQKNEEDIVKNSIEGTLAFTDAANGDFNGEFDLAEGAEAPEALGAPMWTITFKAAEAEVAYYLVGSFNDWTPAEDYKLELNSEAGEGVVEYMITLDIPANSSMKVLDNLGNWYPATGPDFVVNDEGNFTVYFRPNADGDEFWFEGYIYCNYNGTTGINSIFAEAVENGKVYNLQGQKVQKTQKGLYIVNGKKVVLK